MSSRKRGRSPTSTEVTPTQERVQVPVDQKCDDFLADTFLALVEQGFPISTRTWGRAMAHTEECGMVCFIQEHTGQDASA